MYNILLYNASDYVITAIVNLYCSQYGNSHTICPFLFTLLSLSRMQFAFYIHVISYGFDFMIDFMIQITLL